MKNIKCQNGTIYYEKDRNRWRCEYKILDPNTAKMKRKTKIFHTEKDAKDFFSTIQYQKGNSLYAQNNGIPLNLLIRSILEKKYASGVVKARTYLRTMETIRAMEKFDLLKKNIDEITSVDIQMYLNSLKNYSSSSIKKFISQLNQAYKFALNKGYIVQNPMCDIISPRSNKKTRKIRALDLEEQKILTNYLMNIPVKDEPYKVAFLMEMFLGIRIGECLALKPENIDLNKNLIIIEHSVTKDDDGNLIIDETKTPASEREIPIPDFLRDLIIYQINLAKYHKDNLLFVDKNGNIVNPMNANQQLQSSANRLGIKDITTHTLRHTYGTRCIESGMRAVAVQRLMGHTDIGVTLNTYTSIFNKYKLEELRKVNEYYIKNNILNPKDLQIESEVLEHE